MKRPQRSRLGRSKVALSDPDPVLFDPGGVDRRETDERYTPPWVFLTLGLVFDLDVAAPPGGVPWIPARRVFTADDDGLTQPWAGSVWCNPPFSQAAAFSRRFIEHGDGVGLFPMSRANWLSEFLEAAEVVHFPGNIKFSSPTHTGQHVSFAVVIAGVGPSAHAVHNLKPSWVKP